MDYVVKPFSPTELAARIRAALRRRAASEPPEPYVHGALTIDYAARRVTLGGRPVPLVAMEYRMLAELSANAGRVLTYEQLLERVWGKRSKGDVRPMRTIVSKLRRKLGEDGDNPVFIFTEPRVGYRMPLGGDGEWRTILNSLSGTAVGAKVKQLLDSRIDATVRTLMAPVSILDADFEQKIERLPHDEARASVMEHALRAQIKERIAENPAFYERLSEALERIIRELRARLIESAEGCRRMAALRSEVHREEAIASEHGLTPVSFAIYGLLARGSSHAGDDGPPDRVSEEPGEYRIDFDPPLKEAARDIDAIIERHSSIIDWWENLDVQRVMRRDIKRLLRDTKRYEEDELDELVRQVVEVARRRLP